MIKRLEYLYKNSAVLDGLKILAPDSIKIILALKNLPIITSGIAIPAPVEIITFGLTLINRKKDCKKFIKNFILHYFLDF